MAPLGFVVQELPFKDAVMSELRKEVATKEQERQRDAGYDVERG